MSLIEFYISIDCLILMTSPIISEGAFLITIFSAVLPFNDLGGICCPSLQTFLMPKPIKLVWFLVRF